MSGTRPLPQCIVALYSLLLLCSVGSAVADEPPSRAPGEIEGLVLWLDAADAATLFADAAMTTPAVPGGPVGAWADKSFAGIHGLQTGEEHRPELYTGPESILPALTFAPEGKERLQWLDLEGLQEVLTLPAWTVFLALKHDRSQSDHHHDSAVLVAIGEFSGRAGYIGFRGTPRCPQYPCVEFANRVGGKHDIRTEHPAGPDWQVWEFRHSSEKVTVRADGALAGSGPLGSRADLPWIAPTLGGAFHRSQGIHDPFRGLIGEVIVYDRALSDEELVAVRGYLAAKWPPTGVYADPGPERTKRNR